MHLHIDCWMSIGTNSPAFQLWVRLVRSHQRIQNAVDAAFKAEGLPPLEWYDVLLELERHGEPLRARDLERKLLLAQYNLSRLLDRLEKQRLIVRRADPEDGRSRLIEISERGLATRRKMWPVYKQQIEGSIGHRLSVPEAKELAELLEPISLAEDKRSTGKGSSK